MTEQLLVSHEWPRRRMSRMHSDLFVSCVKSPPCLGHHITFTLTHFELFLRMSRSENIVFSLTTE